MQKPTEVQLDETISEKVVAEIGSTVPNEVRSIMAKTLTRKSFVSIKVSKKFRKDKPGTNSNDIPAMVIEHESSKQKKGELKETAVQQQCCTRSNSLHTSGTNC